MGNRFETPTDEINYAASVAVAERARNAGVRNFVFASSCSIYGFAEDGPRKETDSLNPLTAYARSKIGTEQALARDGSPATWSSPACVSQPLAACPTGCASISS